MSKIRMYNQSSSQGWEWNGRTFWPNGKGFSEGWEWNGRTFWPNEKGFSEGWEWDGRYFKPFGQSPSQGWEWDGRYFKPYGQSPSQGWECEDGRYFKPYGETRTKGLELIDDPPLICAFLLVVLIPKNHLMNPTVPSSNRDSVTGFMYVLPTIGLIVGAITLLPAMIVNYILGRFPNRLLDGSLHDKFSWLFSIIVWIALAIILLKRKRRASETESDDQFDQYIEPFDLEEQHSSKSSKLVKISILATIVAIGILGFKLINSADSLPKNHFVGEISEWNNGDKLNMAFDSLISSLQYGDSVYLDLSVKQQERNDNTEIGKAYGFYYSDPECSDPTDNESPKGFSCTGTEVSLKFIHNSASTSVYDDGLMKVKGLFVFMGGGFQNGNFYYVLEGQ